VVHDAHAQAGARVGRSRVRGRDGGAGRLGSTVCRRRAGFRSLRGARLAGLWSGDGAPFPAKGLLAARKQKGSAEAGDDQRER
jgi:hypothetical protein